MAGNKITLIEQVILVSLMVFCVLVAAVCGVGYYFAEGDLADAFESWGVKAFIAFWVIAMAGHAVLGFLQRFFNFRL